MATPKRERQKALRAQKKEAAEKSEKRQQIGRKTLTALVVVVLLAGSAIYLFRPRHAQVVTIPAGSTAVTSPAKTPAAAVPGFVPIPAPLPAGVFGKAPTVTVPTTPPPPVEEATNLIVGHGPAIKVGDTFTAHYVLADFASHKILQSSWQTHAFACDKSSGCNLSYNYLIHGWVNGMVGMKVGGRRELIIPPALGYGVVSGSASIPNNDTLLFVIDLLKVN